MQLPYWHPELEKLASLPRIKSGCSLVNGNIQCNPGQLARIYEQALRKHNLYWGRITNDQVSMARYIATEVGSGTPEEKVAVAEAGRNRAKMWRLTVDQLLRLRQRKGHPNRGFYGPIHGSGGGAPYGRWAGTKKDPKPQDLVIAKMVLDGKTNNFAKGADDQIGPSAGEGLGFGADWGSRKIRSQAKKKSYWVGLLPGVNHRRTFLFRTIKNIDPDSAPGKKLVSSALNWVNKVPDWSKTPVELKTAGFFDIGIWGWIAAIGSAAILGYSLWERHQILRGPVAIPSEDYLVFKLPGCGACEEFVPKFREAAQNREISFREIDAGTPRGDRLASELNVEEFPAIINNKTQQRWLGPNKPEEIFGENTTLPQNAPE